MQPPRPSVTPVPANALFHFCLAQDEYVGVLNAVQYFAKNLRNAREKEILQRALARLDHPTGLSVQSEEDVTKAEPEIAKPVSASPMGLASLGAKK